MIPQKERFLLINRFSIHLDPEINSGWHSWKFKTYSPMGRSYIELSLDNAAEFESCDWVFILDGKPDGVRGGCPFLLHCIKIFLPLIQYRLVIASLFGWVETISRCHLSKFLLLTALLYCKLFLVRVLKILDHKTHS